MANIFKQSKNALTSLVNKAAKKVKSELEENLGIGKPGFGDAGKRVQQAMQNPVVKQIAKQSLPAPAKAVVNIQSAINKNSKAKQVQQQTTNVVKDIVRATPRTAAQIALSVDPRYKNLPTFTPETPAQKLVFGAKPIDKFSDRVQANATPLAKIGIKGDAAKLLGTGLALGGVLGDLTPTSGGNAKNKLFNAIAKSDKAEDILKALKVLNIEDDAARKLAPKLAKEVDVAKITSVLESAPKGQRFERNLYGKLVDSKVGRAVTSGKAGLRNQGPAGGRLADLGIESRRTEQRLTGALQSELQQALRPLKKPEDRKLVTEILEGRLPTSGKPQIDAAADKVRSLLNSVARQAQEVGIQIKGPDGQLSDFKPRENYFPRQYNLDEMQKAANRDKYLNHLIETGQARNYADADRLFENFLKGQGERTYGNLEKARTADLPGYETDPLKAIDSYVKGASRRLAEVKAFGPKDEVAKDLIEQVRRQGGDYKYAQEVFDLVTGKKQYKNPIVDATAKFDVLSKLDLSFVTNATQPVNTGTKFGIMRTLDSVLKAYTRPFESGDFARKVGAITDDIARQDSGVGNTIMDAILSPFTYIEKKNRTSAALAAADFTKSVAEKLAKDPANRVAIRQMRSLGLNPEKIIAQGGPTAEDILSGAKVGSDLTQFQVDALEIPPGWKTNVGRLLTRFKSFTFKQQEFIRDEVLKEAAAGNFAPLMRIMVLGVPASYLSAKGRNILSGRDEKDDAKGGLDVRDLDKYFKAIGALPLELATQGQFLKKTYDSPYATDLRKIGRTASTLLGPTVGDTFKVIDSLEQASQIKRSNQDLPKGKQPSDPYLDLKRFAAGAVPIVGEQIKNRSLAYPTDNVSDFTRVIRALEAGDDAALEKALNTYRPSTRSATLKRAQKTLQEQGKEAKNTNYPSTNADTAKAADIGSLITATKDARNGVEKTQTKYNSIADKSLATAQFNQDKNRLKRDDPRNSEAIVDIYRQRIDDLANYMRSLNPMVDQAQITRTQDTIEKLTAEVKKYAAQGGFTKPKKAKKGKTVKVAKKLKVAKTSIKKPKSPKVKIVTVKSSSKKAPKSLKVESIKPKLPQGGKRGRKTKKAIRVTR